MKCALKAILLRVLAVIGVMVQFSSYSMQQVAPQPQPEPSAQEQFLNPNPMYFFDRFEQEYAKALPTFLMDVRKSVDEGLRKGFKKFFKDVVKKDDSITVIAYSPRFGQKKIDNKNRFFASYELDFPITSAFFAAKYTAKPFVFGNYAAIKNSDATPLDNDGWEDVGSSEDSSVAISADVQVSALYKQGIEDREKYDALCVQWMDGQSRLQKMNTEDLEQHRFVRQQMLDYKRRQNIITLDECKELNDLHGHKTFMVSSNLFAYWQQLVVAAAEDKGRSFTDQYDHARLLDAMAKRRLSGGKSYYEDLDRAYTNNFSGIKGLEQEGQKYKFYEFFGFKKEDRDTISYEEIRAKIEEEIAKAVARNDHDMLFRVRQYEMPFRSKVSLEEYKLFLEGPEAFKQFDSLNYDYLDDKYTDNFKDKDGKHFLHNVAIESAKKQSYEFLGFDTEKRFQIAFSEVADRIKQMYEQCNNSAVLSDGDKEQLRKSIEIFAQPFESEESKKAYDLYLYGKDACKPYERPSYNIADATRKAINNKIDKIDPLMKNYAYHACGDLLKSYAHKFDAQRERFFEQYQRHLEALAAVNGERYKKAQKKLEVQRKEFHKLQERARRQKELLILAEQQADNAADTIRFARTATQLWQERGVIKDTL